MEYNLDCCHIKINDAKNNQNYAELFTNWVSEEKEFKTFLLPLIWRRWPWGWRGWSSGSTWSRSSPWSCTCWSGSSGETWWRDTCDNGGINIEDQGLTNRLSGTFCFSIQCLFSNGVKVPVHCYCRQCKYTGVHTQILKHECYKQYIFSERGREKTSDTVQNSTLNWF